MQSKLCVVQERLKISEKECESLKVMIRSDAMLTADNGCNYACAISKILFAHMGMSEFKVERCGQYFGISYILSEK